MTLPNRHEFESLPAKLSRPRMQRIHPRERVFSKLSDIHSFKAVWVTGPAGSGKTAVVNSFLENGNCPCLWYSMDEGDSDIASFFYYMRLAAKAYLTAEAVLPPMLTPDYLPNISVYARRFFEKVFAIFPAPFALVLDDYHEVDDESPLHEVISSAITQIPKEIRLYVLSREEPPSELARSRANCKLHLLGWEHLRLTPDETRGIAHKIMGSHVPEKSIADLQSKTDGWVAGLILLLRRGEFEGIKPQYLSKHTPHEIFDYFGGELFDRLHPSIRSKMLQFAFLSRISADAADQITRSKDGQTLLERLHKRNIFLNRLVEEEISYQFHPLLRDFLQLRAYQTLSPTELKDLQRRSADILVQEENIEEAVKLYLEAGEMEAATHLILTRAPVYASQGRFRSLDHLINSLPETITDNSPWFIYWRTACRLPFAVKEGEDLPSNEELRGLFARALSLFEQAADPVGSYLSLAGILESTWMELNELAALDPWIAKYDKMRDRWGPNHPPEVMPWLTPAVLGALMFRQPNHPLVTEWIDKGMGVLRTVSENAVRIRVFLNLALFRLFQGDLTATKDLITVFQASADESISPVGALLFHSVNSFYCWQSGQFGQCTATSTESVALMKKYGIHMLHPLLHGAIGAINSGDMKTAERLLRKVNPVLSGAGWWAKALYMVVAGWFALIDNDFVRAKAHAEEGLDAGEKAGCPSTLPVHYLQCAVTYHLSGETNTAAAHLNQAIEFCRRYHTRQVEFGCRLAEAEFALNKNNPNQLGKYLERAFRLGREYGYVTTYFWRPQIMADLCAKALNRGIEVDYVKHLIQQRHLVPDKPPRNILHWPWPFRIRTFGGFSLQIDGEPFFFKGKAGMRLFSLLKYVLAAKNHRVPDFQIQDDLWPDSDGDRATNAFRVSLHRLRKMLKDPDAILRRSGQVSLNERKCWTDVWALEDVAGEAESLPKGPESAPQAKKLVVRLLHLYQGPFLPGEEAFWAIHTRQTFTRRFVRLIEMVTGMIAKAGDDHSAVDLLNRAVAAEPFEETLHFLLMETFHRMGEPHKAVRLFEHYQENLFCGFGVSPSERITSLYKKLKKERF